MTAELASSWFTLRAYVRRMSGCHELRMEVSWSQVPWAESAWCLLHPLAGRDIGRCPASQRGSALATRQEQQPERQGGVEYQPFATGDADESSVGEGSEGQRPQGERRDERHGLPPCGSD